MLSKYCLGIANEYETKIGGVNKLVKNLDNKSKFVLLYRNLQLYLSLGIKVTKIHRILRFEQFDWLKDTGKRRKADKDVFKLMNNSVFGKTMEN